MIALYNVLWKKAEKIENLALNADTLSIIEKYVIAS
jgi:hypothetical protein